MPLVSRIYSLARTRFPLGKAQAEKIGASQDKRNGKGKRRHKKKCAPPDQNASFEERRTHYREVYLRSKHWLATRKGFLDRHGRQCVECSSRKNIQVHHVTYERIGRERDEDLKVLCRECHKKAHGICN